MVLVPFVWPTSTASYPWFISVTHVYPFLSTFLSHLPIFTLIYPQSTPFTPSCPHFNHLPNFKLSAVDLILLPVVTPSYCYYIANHVSSRFPTLNYPKLHPSRSVSRFFTVTPILHIRVIPFFNTLATLATSHPHLLMSILWCTLPITRSYPRFNRLTQICLNLPAFQAMFTPSLTHVLPL